MEMKRKTPSQLQSLEQLYSENNYPTKEVIEDYAAALGLTYKQVRGWFVEKRRRDKRENGIVQPSHLTSIEKCPIITRRNGSGIKAARKVAKGYPLMCDSRTPSSSICKRSSMARNWNAKRKKTLFLLQDLLTPDYILKKVFRKDGPPLGVEFDSLPSGAFSCVTDFNPCCEDSQSTEKRRKVSQHVIVSHQVSHKKSAPLKMHGVGKGLMTVWRATNPDGGDFPTGVDFGDREVGNVSLASTSVPQRKTRLGEKRPRKKQSPVAKQGRFRNKSQDKRRQSIRRTVEPKRSENPKQSDKQKCELALEAEMSLEYLDQVAMLVDDEELELQELRGPNHMRCSDHFAANAQHGCSLCKGLLAKFPPNTVKMKQPLCMQPWDSSPEIVKKLFKIFHFLYTYAVEIDICPFTLDEFAQAFHHKDSLLLGKIHVALLKLLIADVEAELGSGFSPRLSKSCNFLALLHLVENQKAVLDFWKRSLNALTWIEILRQVLVAAGFGSKQAAMRREAISKEMNLMVKYGLRPGTLKCELFKILSEQGSKGLKVSELAKSFQIVELNLASTTEELESLICSTLSSDITLFEKISLSAYRLRINSVAKDVDEFDSDTEDSGSVDDDPDDNGPYSSDDLGCESGNSKMRKLMDSCHKSQSNTPAVYNEIDESHPGEVWLLGLMEGEYSDLSVEERLNALAALTDLLLVGSSIRIEDPTQTIAESVPNIQLHGSGAKLKRLSVNQNSLARLPCGYALQTHGIKEVYSFLRFHPVDSSVPMSKFYEKGRSSGNGGNVKEKEVDFVSHPMQSLFLGSDRRYNRYWLFLGPCNALDPGHSRIYFESSEDGHWEVIDSVEDLCALLSVLDDRGKREALLIESLEKRRTYFCQAMSNRVVNCAGTRHLTQSIRSVLDMVREDSCSPVSDVDNNLSLIETVEISLPSSGVVLDIGAEKEEQEERWSHLQAFDSWIWNSFYSNLNCVKYGRKSYLDSLARCESCHDLYWRDEKHCRICHTTFELDFDLEERYAIHTATCREKEDANIMFPQHKVLSSRIQSLKAAVHAIESVMPEEALVGAWTKSAHKLWVKRLRRTSSLADFLQVLADFVGAINENWLSACSVQQVPYYLVEETIASFASMPQTSSAAALWLVKLDALIAPHLERVHSGKKQVINTRGRRAPKQSMHHS